MELPLRRQEFAVEGRLVTLQPLGNGNVNDTYLAVFRNTFTETQLVLQRINGKVFPTPAAIMSNMHKITAHCHAKLEKELDTADRVWQMPRIVQTRDGRDCVQTDDGAYWRVITLIPSARAYDRAQNAEHAMECGAVLGHFHHLVADFDPTSVQDPLPGFHVTPGYLAAYDATLAEPKAAAKLDASMEARRCARFVENRRRLATVFQDAVDRGELRRRMVHGDPKVNNIMIDEFTAKGTAMIDLDTVSAGLVHIDFGDALRSICNPAGEEEQNLAKVRFDEDLCLAFCKGYMAEASDFLTDADRAYLYDAIRLLPFELGLRFFQDYLAGDVYFKTRSPEQNLARARVQFRLCESIEARERSIRSLIDSL